MKAPAALRGLTGPQWRAFTAAFLGWMLDAFDYFLVVMVIDRIAADFHTGLKDVSYALFLTLAFRPVGALLFGLIADRCGRRPALMGSIILYAAVEFASGFAPDLRTFLILRALFGIGMGGEWGVGASLAMESVPAPSRGLLSGILQQGYPAGYMLAALAVWAFLPQLGWRGMFMVGAVPAVLVIYIRLHVPESPAWEHRNRPAAPGRARTAEFWAALGAHWRLILYMALLMMAFNGFSHGTQDLYPKGFLGAERKLPLRTISAITIINNLGAITGGILFGALSQRLGRRRAIAASALLALPMIPLWIGGTTTAALALGGFLMQFAVQGAWGVVPAHLNELSPAAVRGTLPGLAYQLGNLGASYVGPLQATLAEAHGGHYSFALGWVVGIGAVILAGLALLGPEARTAELAPASA